MGLVEEAKMLQRKASAYDELSKNLEISRDKLAAIASDLKGVMAILGVKASTGSGTGLRVMSGKYSFGNAANECMQKMMEGELIGRKEVGEMYPDMEAMPRNSLLGNLKTRPGVKRTSTKPIKLYYEKPGMTLKNPKVISEKLSHEVVGDIPDIQPE